MLATRFWYNGKLRAGIVHSNHRNKKGKRFLTLQLHNGRYKSFSWKKMRNVELFLLGDLKVQVFKV